MYIHVNLLPRLYLFILVLKRYLGFCKIMEVQRQFTILASNSQN